MKTLSVVSLLVMTLGAAGMDANENDIYYGDNWDNTMAEIHGTCTRLTCLPGTRVKVDAVPGESGIAETWNRQGVDLQELVGLELVVMGTDGHSSSAWVLAPGGIAYSIQWIFLKKVADKKPKDLKTKSPGVVATGLAQSCAQHFQREIGLITGK